MLHVTQLHSLHPSTHGTITTYFSNIQLFPQSTFNNMIAEIWNWYVPSFEGFEERNIWFENGSFIDSKWNLYYLALKKIKC